MIAVLLFLACSSEAPTSAEPPEEVAAPAEEQKEAPKKKGKAGKAAWVGEWTMDGKVLTTSKAGEVKLMQDDEVVASGTLEGKGKKRTAALDGCGGTFEISGVGGDVEVSLEGPECPVEFAGTYTPKKTE